MKRIIFAFACACAAIGSAQTPSLSWIRKIGGSSYDGVQYLKHYNNALFAIGWFDETVDFDPGPGVTNLTGTGGNDIFVSKFDLAGNFIWVKAIGGPGNDFAASIDIDSSGDILLTGYFTETCDFDPGPAIYPLSTGTLTSDFICKLDGQGDFIWAKKFHGTVNYGPFHLLMGQGNNYYVAGSFEGTVDLDPGTGVYNVTAIGNSEAFILKMNSNGNFVWAKTIAGWSLGGLIDFDPSGNICFLGGFVGVTDLDPGPGVFTVGTNTASSGSFIIKFDTNGNFIWGKEENFPAEFLKIAPSGNMYVSGSFGSGFDFDPGPATYNIPYIGWTDIFIGKLDNSGNILWGYSLGGSEYDSPLSVTMDAQENIYIAGRFRTTVDFDAGPGTKIFTTIGPGADDGFVIRIGSDGVLHWAAHIKGNMVYAIGCTLDNAGNIYVGGSYFFPADFDPGPGTYTLIASASDGYLMKLTQPIGVGIAKHLNDPEFTLYPVPFAGELNLSYSREGTVIELMDITGEIITSELGTGDKVRIVTESLPPGIYFITVFDGQNYIRKKIVKTSD
jgi:hypothetical protein